MNAHCPACEKSERGKQYTSLERSIHFATVDVDQKNVEMERCQGRLKDAEQYLEGLLKEHRQKERKKSSRRKAKR